MLLIDDLLTAPFRGLLWIFQEIANAAREEQAGEEDNIRQQLVELYMLLETEKITEAEFDAREKPLLDRLDQVQASRGS